MSQPTFNERAKTFVDRTKALFTLDPRWHEDPVYEGDVDPRVGELLERLLSADPIARTEDDEMVVRLDPDTLRGWLITEVDAAEDKASTPERDDAHRPEDAEGQGAEHSDATATPAQTQDQATKRKLTPLPSGPVRELRHRPELLKRFHQTGNWDEAES